MDIKRAVGGFLLSFVFLAFFVYSISCVKLFFDSLDSRIFLGSLPDSINIENSIPESVLPQISKPELTAKSAITVESDLQGTRKVIFDKDADAQLPIASLTKLMTAVIILEDYDLSQIISVSETANAHAPVEQDIKLGDTMSVENFLYIMLVGSSNKAAYALSEVIGTQEFVELMNQKAQEIGMQNTALADPAGLSPQNLSTVNDLVKLAEYILNNYPKIAWTSSIKELHIYNFGDLKNTNELLGDMPGIVCGKTGFTAAAKGCLLLVVNNSKNNNYLISVILGADNRFSEMKNLINWSSTMCK